MEEWDNEEHPSLPKPPGKGAMQGWAVGCPAVLLAGGTEGQLWTNAQFLQPPSSDGSSVHEASQIVGEQSSGMRLHGCTILEVSLALWDKPYR